jgi:hypothetical protein
MRPISSARASATIPSASEATGLRAPAWSLHLRPRPQGRGFLHCSPRIRVSFLPSSSPGPPAFSRAGANSEPGISLFRHLQRHFRADSAAASLESLNTEASLVAGQVRRLDRAVLQSRPAGIVRFSSPIRFRLRSKRAPALHSVGRLYIACVFEPMLRFAVSRRMPLSPAARGASSSSLGAARPGGLDGRRGDPPKCLDKASREWGLPSTAWRR